MAQSSNIEWTDATWNPVTGCDKVSPGCAHCYAEAFAERWRGIPGHHFENGFDLTLRPERLEQPLKWRKPRRVFVNSMSDLFHEDIPNEYIAAVFGVMAAAQQHTFQVLTKREDRMREWFAWYENEVRETENGWSPGAAAVEHARAAEVDARYLYCVGDDCPWPLPNVWLGVSIENRRFVHRADELRGAPAAVRFISAEPLLGPLVPTRFEPETGDYGEVLGGEWFWPDGKLADLDSEGLDLTGIDWLIVGGESGAGHRPMREDWVRDLREACLARGDFCSACGGTGRFETFGPDERRGLPCLDCSGLGRFNGTAFFLKQWGGARPGGEALLDGREWREFPALSEVPA